MPPRTIKEKIREALLAIKVEQELSKDQILAKYLNTVYFGHGAYGAEAAAQTYFDMAGVGAHGEQSAVLAAVLHAPSLYDPIKSTFDNEFRRDYTLDQMAKYGYITAERGQAHEGGTCCGIPKSQRQGTRASRARPTRSTSSSGRGPSCSIATAAPSVYGGGLQITTTLDLNLQRMAEEAVDDEPARHRLQPRRGARDDRQRHR